MRKLVNAVCLALAVRAGMPSAQAAIAVVADYSGEEALAGFNEPVVGPMRKAAFEYALALVGGLFDERYAGETIRVLAEFEPLGGSPVAAVLGFGGPQAFYHSAVFDNEPVAAHMYPSALANHRDQSAFTTAAPFFATHEINVTFNSDVDDAVVLGATNWYYGTDASPGIHIDMATVALHELTHGLGFTPLVNSAGAYVAGFPPGIFDHFMNTDAAGGTKLEDLASDAERQDEISLQIDDPLAVGVWWDGANGTAGNGGARPKMYAPDVFQPGATLFHLDELTLPLELMSPFYSGPDHTFSAIERGMLTDRGWTLTAIPESGAWLFGGVAACVAGAHAGVKRFLGKLKCDA